jgi:hypothetical protein
MTRFRELLFGAVVVQGSTGSFDCDFASHSRSKILAHDEIENDRFY